MSATSDTFIEPALFLTDEDIAQVADFPSAIDALRQAYSTEQAPGSTPGRAVATTATGWMRVMPSAPTGHRLAGFKVISAAITNGQVSYLIALFDIYSSSLVALLDGNRVTGMRTAATAAVAVQAMMRPGPQIVAVIGSGFEAREQLTAIACVSEVSDVRVFSPTQSKRESFAADMSAELGVTVTALDTAAGAAAGADLIICAARSRDESPTLLHAWVEPHARIVSVGSTTSAQRELDTALIGAADVIIADAMEEVLGDSGDMIAARADGYDPDARTFSLESVALGTTSVNESTGIVIYKSTGSGFQDVVLAERIYERAVASGLGTALPTNILTNRK